MNHQGQSLPQPGKANDALFSFCAGALSVEDIQKSMVVHESYYAKLWFLSEKLAVETVLLYLPFSVIKIVVVPFQIVILLIC